jgi:hypothetical protein
MVKFFDETMDQDISYQLSTLLQNYLIKILIKSSLTSLLEHDALCNYNFLKKIIDHVGFEITKLD